jgi:hypothetical protein
MNITNEENTEFTPITVGHSKRQFRAEMRFACYMFILPHFILFH